MQYNWTSVSQWAKKLKKAMAKKLEKSKKSISRKIYLLQISKMAKNQSLNWEKV